MLLVFLILALTWQLSYLAVNIGLFEEEWHANNEAAERTNQAAVNYYAEQGYASYRIGNKFTQQHLDEVNFGVSIGAELARIGLPLFMRSLPYPLIILTLSVLYFLIYPRITIWRKKLHVPDPKQDETLIINVFDQIVSQTAVIPKPILLMSETHTDAQAVGLLNKGCIIISPQHRALAKFKPKDFRTILQHEIAHIFNRDLLLAFIDRSLWNFWIFLVVIPFVAFMIYRIFFVVEQGDFAYLMVNTARLFLLSVVLKIIANSVIRVRELYADWRVASWGSADDMERLIHESPPPRRKSQSALTLLFDYHPSSIQRLASIQNPDKLFLVKPDLCITAGLTLGLALSFISALESITETARDGIVTLLPSTLMYWHFADRVGTVIQLSDLLFVTLSDSIGRVMQETIIIIPYALVSLLIAGTIGIQVQRQVAFELHAKSSPFKNVWRAVKTAILMAIGMELGFSLEFGQALYPENNIISLIAIVFISFVCFSSLCFIWLQFIRYMFNLMINSHYGWKMPSLKQIFVTFNIAICFLFLCMPLFHIRVTIGLYDILDYQTEFLRSLIILVYCVMGLLAQNILILVMWIFMILTRKVWPPKCPVCGSILSRIYIGSACTHCGRPVSNWLYLHELPVVQT